MLEFSLILLALLIFWLVYEVIIKQDKLNNQFIHCHIEAVRVEDSIFDEIKQLKEKYMPSKSKSQARLMAAAAHTPGGYDGVPTKVGKEFNKADKGTGILKGKKTKTKAKKKK